MARIYVGGAGGAPSNNFIKSLRHGSRGDHFIGASCVPSDLFLADVEERYVIPPARSDSYEKRVIQLWNRTRPDFIHLQHDFEVQAVSRLRTLLDELKVKYFLPSQATIDACVDKAVSAAIWSGSGIKVPRTILINTYEDLKRAFDQLGQSIWLRANEGGGGRGALPTDNIDFAKNWIDRFGGWGSFSASELLTKNTVTWLSLWFEGELVVAQTRARHSWNFGDRTLSGVTGITGVGITRSDSAVDRVALDSILAVDNTPHGIFGVDMTYDSQGIPNPTEINIGRFFTTHFFFTQAGLNLPEIYVDIALDGKFPSLDKKINPLPDGLVWIRGMDSIPVLTTEEELAKLEQSGVGGENS